MGSDNRRNRYRRARHWRPAEFDRLGRLVAQSPTLPEAKRLCLYPSLRRLANVLYRDG